MVLCIFCSFNQKKSCIQLFDIETIINTIWINKPEADPEARIQMQIVNRKMQRMWATAGKRKAASDICIIKPDHYGG